uniref:Uncharacterized protein n=1 Tax=Sphaerodactylus townsendi TaxID=933632 RepID=A0ACB8G271_9SAUR
MMHNDSMGSSWRQSAASEASQNYVDQLTHLAKVLNITYVVHDVPMTADPDLDIINEIQMQKTLWNNKIRIELNTVHKPSMMQIALDEIGKSHLILYEVN